MRIKTKEKNATRDILHALISFIVRLKIVGNKHKMYLHFQDWKRKANKQNNKLLYNYLEQSIWEGKSETSLLILPF